MSKFFPLKVSNIIRETADANTIVFEKPAGADFEYKPGQYLTLKADINGESTRRAYSLCSSPITDPALAVTVKRVEGGVMSNYLPDHLKVGDVMEVLPPMGNFVVELDAGKFQHYVLIAGGSGITPLMSIAKSVLQEEPYSKVSLFYANRDVESIIFRKELMEMEATYADRIKVVHNLDTAPADWTGLTGVPNRMQLFPVMQDIIDRDNLPKVFYMCGPLGMMEEAQAALSFMGVSPDQIKRELFTAPQKTAEAESAVAAAATDNGEVEGKPGDYSILVMLDGDEKTVEVKQSVTILEAVLDAGMDPPYACQMGVCTTCRAKTHVGTVEMEEDEGLSDSEIADGYILTCMAHPMTPNCKIEFM